MRGVRPVSRITLRDVEKKADAVEAAQDAHEQVCAERYGQIFNALSEMKTRHTRMELAIVGLMISVMGWLATQVWEGRNHQPAAPTAVVAVAK